MVKTALWFDGQNCLMNHSFMYSRLLVYNIGPYRYVTYIWKLHKVKMRIPVHKGAPWTLN
jgi:hypothetical protein